MSICMKRVTLTLPDELLKMADSLAGQEGTSRSGFIQRILVDFLEIRRRRELATKLEQGYRAMAAESTRLSGQFAQAEDEALLGQTGADDDDVDW